MCEADCLAAGNHNKVATKLAVGWCPAVTSLVKRGPLMNLQLSMFKVCTGIFGILYLICIKEPEVAFLRCFGFGWQDSESFCSHGLLVFMC
jgi:hypothetical protein